MCGTAGSHEQMSDDNLIGAFEDIYKDLARLHPRCSSVRPHRWVEDEVCLNLDGYLAAQEADRVDNPEGERVQFLVHVRQCYRELHGKPPVFDSGRMPHDLAHWNAEPIRVFSNQLLFSDPNEFSLDGCLTFSPDVQGLKVSAAESSHAQPRQNADRAVAPREVQGQTSKKQTQTVRQQSASKSPSASSAPSSTAPKVASCKFAKPYDVFENDYSGTTPCKTPFLQNILLACAVLHKVIHAPA